MPVTRATTVQQRQEMARLAQAGLSQPAVASQVGVSFWTARKWIRRAGQGDLAAMVTEWGRPPTGPMAAFDPLVRYVALRLKCQHPTWGGGYVVKKMSERPSLAGQALPEATTVWRYWRSFGDRLFPKRPAPELPLPLAGVAHGVWQMDAKESMSIPGVGTVTLNQARDEFGRATVMHRIHPAPSGENKIVKLTSAQIQQDCRIAFTQWGLPDAIQTDRASIFVDGDPTPFPTRLSLWWVGLGIQHRLIPRHTPERNGAVERSHRTLNERTLIGQSFNGPDHLQRQIDADWEELNTQCPSRARNCQGQPPLVAHPELLLPRRPYRPEWELELFDLRRVDAALAAPTWLRSVSANGQLGLGGYHYRVGRAWADQIVSIRFDPEPRQFVFSLVHPEAKPGRRVIDLAPIRREPQGLSVEDLTGLPTALQDLPVRQLMLPLLMCYPALTVEGA